MSTAVLALVLAASVPGRAFDAQLRVDPFLSQDSAVASGSMFEAVLGARADATRVQLRLSPVEVLRRESSSARASATVLVGFATDDMELSAGFGRVLALAGDLPSDLDHLVFTWLTRFGDLEGTSFTAVAGHALPEGPVFATVDLSLQVVVARGFWITTRAASHFGGYLLAEVGIRSRVADSGTYLRVAAGAHAFATGAELCLGDACSTRDVAVPSPSLSLGVEWR